MCPTKDKVDDFKSRSYQDEILKKCIERNTIIYLPTGAGKTYIAIMAIKHFASDLQKPLKEGGKRSIFLTTTRALAHQQADSIQKLTPLKIGVYTSDLNVDAWKGDKWYTEFEQNQVIVATCQIVLDVVRHGYMKMSDFNLIVFDECHNGRKEHPMVHMMAKLSDYPIEDHPRIIGLSGSLTSSSVKPSNVLDDIKSLETTFRSTITTVQELKSYADVLMYSTCPKESILQYEMPSQTKFIEFIKQRTEALVKTVIDWPIVDARSSVDQTLARLPSIQKQIKGTCTDFDYQISNTGLYGGLLANLATIVDLEVKKREADNSISRTLLRTLITAYEEHLHFISEKLYDDDDEIDDMDADVEIDESKIAEDPTMILTNSTPQVQRLLIYLQKFSESHESSNPMKGLIFVERRHSAKILCHIIRRFVNSYPKLNIRVDFMTGYNSQITDSIETLLAKKCNDRVLEKFKRDELNLIICTSVLEEGIDLQECNLVIAYDLPKHYRSYVQTRGRARMSRSEYVIMTPLGETQKLQKNIAEWSIINDILKKYLVEKAIDRPPPNQDDIDEMLEKTINEQYNSRTGATIDYHSAISILNRYCDLLPRDSFTMPTVTWRRIDKPDKKIIVCILLPIQSPVNYEICGKEMPTLKLAKRSAAFEVCKELHKKGGLNDHLLPVSQLNCLKMHKDEYFKVWNDPEFRNDCQSQAGTRKQYRILDLQIPEALQNSMPQLKQKLYLYKIIIRPNFSTSDVDDNVVVFHQLLQSNRSYGILTMKPIPRLGLMKFYQSFGELETIIDHIPNELIIENTKQLDELKRFNCTLFRDVLEVSKEFLVYDRTDSFIVVPTIGEKIDWDIVQGFQTWSSVKEKTVSERTNVSYEEKDWLHKVVCPWYRADSAVRYVVTRVSRENTPFSPFPNEAFESYAAYAIEKYEDVITKVMVTDQFLIEVKGITQNLDVLHPGMGEDGRRTKINRGQELLIPELCHNFNYPGDLWLKAIVLPSTIHRLTYLLHAEKIRISINDYLGLKIIDYQPQMLLSKTPRNNKPIAKIIQNSIIHPRPGEMEAKEIRSSDISRYNAVNELLGPEIQQPIDIERNFDQLHELDIDYYHEFINDRFRRMSINETNMNGNTLLPTRLKMAEHRALCDIPSDERVQIKLLATKLNTPLERGVEQNNLLAAITTTSSGDTFHMELFEVLGDAFLKFGVSLSLMRNHKDWHEGFLTAMKGQVVGNRNLCYNAIKMRLPGMINKNNFNPKDDWQPPMLKVDDSVKKLMKEKKISPNDLYQLALSKTEVEAGKVSNETLIQFEQTSIRNDTRDDQESSMANFLGLQRIADKTNADCVEAILGACLVSIGVDRTFKILEMFNILPQRPNVDITQLLQQQFHTPRVRTNITDHEVDSFLPNHGELEKSIGYTFNDRAYLLQALTHPTYPTNRVTGCYQQLEFLGDAILDFLITSYIFERCPHMDPGQLTDLRSALVNNVTLACLCVRYNIHLYILSQNASLTEFIGHFVDFQVKYKHEISDHVELLMEEKDVACKMADYVEVPKTLGDVVEALIGAIFLDSGNNLEVTWKVIYRLMHKELEKFMTNVPIQVVRRLYETPNANPEFDEPVVDGDRTLVSLRFTCNGEILLIHGFGSNKDNAKRAAAKLALLKLRN